MIKEKTKLNSTEVLISKALTDWYISHDEFVLVIDVLKKYDYKEIKNWKTYCALIEKKKKKLIIFWSVGKIQKVKTPQLQRQWKEKPMLLWKYAVRGIKKSRFIKK